MKTNNQKGFTLVELMVVVSIIAILAAIAIPIYMNYIYRGKQVEAKTLLMTIKVEEEQGRAEFNCYTTNLPLLVESTRLFSNNRYFSSAATPVGTVTITGTNGGACTASVALPDNFQAVVTGRLAAGHVMDRWAISDLIPAPVHCDGPRPTYTADQIAACAGVSTTEMEY